VKRLKYSWLTMEAASPIGKTGPLESMESPPLPKEAPDRRRRAQYAVARILSEAQSIAEAAPKLLNAVGKSLGWDVGAIWTIDRGALRCIHVWKAAGIEVPLFEAATREIRFRSGTGLPGRVWSTGKAVWIRDVVRDDNFPRAPMAAAEGLHGAFGFPISTGADVLGVVESFSREVREPDEDLLEMIAAIGSQIGLFMQHREAEGAIRASERRFAFLAEASALLAASLNYERTLAKVARLGVPTLADWCAVDVLEADGSTRRLAVAHMDPEKAALANRMRRRYPPEDAGAGLGKVLRTGRSELFPEISSDDLETIAFDEHHLTILRVLGITSGMWVPLTARGRTLGAITFASSDSGRIYGANDLSLAEELGRVAGVAVDNARLYEERSNIARTLQRSLLPPRLPAIDGIEVAVRYRAAGEGTDVGGDFYDVFEVGKNAWAVMIGDVCGKGPRAAAVTGLARHTLRAASMSEWRPRRVLLMLNDALVRDEVDEYCTAVFARFTRVGTHVRVTLACGGHPPPLLLGANGRVEVAGQPGTLLGVFPDPELATAVIDLQPGDGLLFYTDGVTESRGPGIGLSEGALRELLTERAGGSAEALADAVEQAAVAAQPGGPRDDIALVCLRMTK
jgi:GAF domain-containing protein